MKGKIQTWKMNTINVYKMSSLFKKLLTITKWGIIKCTSFLLMFHSSFFIVSKILNLLKNWTVSQIPALCFKDFLIWRILCSKQSFVQSLMEEIFLIPEWQQIINLIRLTTPLTILQSLLATCSCQTTCAQSPQVQTLGIGWTGNGTARAAEELPTTAVSQLQ